MTNPNRNAAIWYADDGYRPELKGINGRRVAGASFLSGFLAHAQISECVSVSKTKAASSSLNAFIRAQSPQLLHRSILQHEIHRLAPVGTLYFPAPNFAEQLWQRQSVGPNAYSICGITHTTATRAVMRGLHDLRAAPQMPWDAIICTSNSVKASIERNMDSADEALRARFGSVPPRPELPMIPLGINCGSFEHNSAAANRLRRRHNLTENDVVIATLARLSHYGKFNPAPFFIAAQKAQETLGKTKSLHFIACGVYTSKHAKKVFEDAAARFMPDVPFHHEDGATSATRQEVLSGSDIFAFPIDNIQETFGLAPIEAMAAGLPLIVSDWDGMRDTVTADIGIRIPTHTVGAKATAPEAHGYLADAFNYPQYTARLASMSALDISHITQAITALARDDNVRKRLGDNAKKRARSLYDWSVIIPQMQELWGELANIRGAAPNSPERANPVAPLPMDIFASYPSKTGIVHNERIVQLPSHRTVADIFQTLRYNQLGNPFEQNVTVDTVLAHIPKDAPGLTLAELSEALRYNPLTVERCCLFLLKYGLITIT